MKSIARIDPLDPLDAKRVLYQPGHKDALFAFKSERKLMKKMQPCFEADIYVYIYIYIYIYEEYTHFASWG